MLVFFSSFPCLVNKQIWSYNNTLGSRIISCKIDTDDTFYWSIYGFEFVQIQNLSTGHSVPQNMRFFKELIENILENRYPTMFSHTFVFRIKISDSVVDLVSNLDAPFNIPETGNKWITLSPLFFAGAYRQWTFESSATNVGC